jgi:class 3 adenylate cyclase/CHASE3 domain sensor protein
MTGEPAATSATVAEPTDPGPPRRPVGTPDPKLPRMTGVLTPLVNAVARIEASVHAKLLAGFLTGAILLLAMGLLSLLTIARMSDRVAELNQLQDKVDRASQMLYLVTAQSHYRAMALLTQDDAFNTKIAAAKQTFADDLAAIERVSAASQRPLFDRIRDSNARFAASGDRILALYRAGNYQQALKLHLAEEHPISHELESEIGQLQTTSANEMAAARASFASDRLLLMGTVGLFSVASLLTALLAGFVLSWSFIRPVKKMDYALAEIVAGDFDRRVEVPNRDEFGTLTQNLNATTVHLAKLYEGMRTLNATLEQKVEDQLRVLTRAVELKRYLSPQLAESILAGTVDVKLVSRRKNLTIFFSDIRGYTAMSERVEPEELVDSLNEYLRVMTEIVFKYGGTLDKYTGDGMMVFFGDPVPYEDHALRATQMAFEMRRALGELQQRWLVHTEEQLAIGMGISTGYVTVGNIGSSARMEYTVLGNHVNLASRLATRARAGQILVAEKTLVASREFVDAREVDQVALEGVSRPIRIYEINEKVRRPDAEREMNLQVEPSSL